MKQEDSIDLNRLLSVMIAKKKAVIGMVAACTILAAFAAFILPKEYTSQVTVQLVDCDMGISSRPAFISVVNDMELIKSNEVLGPVIEQVFSDIEPADRPDAGRFASKYLAVTNPQGTQIIKIKAKGRTPQEAEYVAEHAAAGFVELKNRSNEEKRALVMSVFGESIANAAKEADAAAAALEKYAAEHGNGSHDLNYQQLSRELEAKKAAYVSLVVQVEQAKIQQSAKAAQIVDAANLPDASKPSGMSGKLIVVGGFVAGCMLSVGYVLLALYRKEI